MTHGLLIDAQGVMWPDHSWALARRIDCADPAVDVATYAVRERSFLHIRLTGERARLALRAGGFGQRALNGALHALGGLKPRRVLLATLDERGDWRYRIFPGVWEVAEHAETLLCPETDEPRPRRADDLQPWRKLLAPVKEG